MEVAAAMQAPGTKVKSGIFSQLFAFLNLFHFLQHLYKS